MDQYGFHRDQPGHNLLSEMYLIRDLVRGGAPGAAAPGVFEILLNEELQIRKIQRFLLVVAPGVLKS